MAKRITRRDFLKGSAAGAAVLTLTGLGLSANKTTAFAEAAEKKLFTPGSYSSVQSTDFATIRVDCEIDAGGVTAVSYEVLDHTGDDYFTLMPDAAQDYCKRIAEAGGTAEVDGISGASLNTAAIRKGVNECLAQALGVEPGKAGAAAVNPQEMNFTNSITDFSKSALFTDWQLGPHTIHNRMVKTSALNWTFMRHNPDEYIGFYERMAKGGVEMIWVEDFADTWNRFKGGNNPMEDYDVKGLLDALHGAGAKVGYQFGTMVCAVGPMDYTAPFIGDYSTEEVKEWIQEISDCALKLKDYGFDAYELNMAANNLGSSFFSRYRNNRTDEYGPQTIESRTRFARELIGSIKEKCGKDFVVQCLINGVEENDKMVGQNDGFNTVEEAAAIARELEAAGADSLHIRIGPCYEHITQFAGDLYFAARGLEGYNSLGTRLDFDKQFQGLIRGNNSGVGLTLDIAAKIKAAVSIPVGCATYNDPALAPDLFNAAIEDGKVDFLMMNRPLCVDPEYVNKLREGRIDEIAPCTRCLHCFFDTPFDRCNMEHCRVNAAYFRAYSDSMPEGYYPPPAETPKKVMVIGGGPAGMEAARVAAERGHSVKLFDKGASLGGLLGFAEAVKGPHENLGRLRAYLARQCELKGVEVVLNTEVTKELIESEAPDAVILAVGGKRAGSGLSSVGATKVMPIEDVLGGNVGENVVILGSGAQAVDTAILLLGQGKKVTLVASEPKDHFEYGHSVYMKQFLSTAFYSAGGRLFPSATVTGVGDGFLSFTAESGIAYEYPCDTVIEALDMLPNTELIEGLDNAFSVGDCERPFNIAYAIATGNMAARKV
jgi:2,4-dienoyl-CoA reductase-like NADH-dependent reductase (Old Yellow Enzyme family)/thioredoxin reductase/uncharacterized protein with FMN-binding domain